MASNVFCTDMLRLTSRRSYCALRATFHDIWFQSENVLCEPLSFTPDRRCLSCWRSNSDEVVGGATAVRMYSLTSSWNHHHRNCKNHTGDGDDCCGGGHRARRSNKNATDPSLPCWKCGRTVDDVCKRYFCECGVVQPPISRRSLFEVMGVKKTFDVDQHELTEKYRDLQRILHPDKYSTKSETEKEFSVQHSSIVNRAYNTLQRPLARGLYLLQLSEEKLEQEMQITGTEFLDEILETNEAILEAESADDVSTIGARNQAKIDDLVLNISEAFKNSELDKAKELLIRLKYYSNIADKIKESLQKFAG